MLKRIVFILILTIPLSSFALDTPTITATAVGPNQVNLSWSAVSNPGWGYKVEIQSDDVNDVRYGNWTDLTALQINGRNYLPAWVTESHYRDRGSGTGTGTGDTSAGPACQFPVFSLRYGATYNFRVRTYGKTDVGVATYGTYSSTASATTTTPTTIRHVKAGATGAANGTSETDAWTHIYDANSVASGSPNGTLIIIHGGNYASDTISRSYGGSSPTARIWYVVDKWSGETATATSHGAYGFLYLTGGSYIVVDGLAMNDNTGQDGINPWYLYGNRLTIANCILNGPDTTVTVVATSPPLVGGSYLFLFGNSINNYFQADGGGGSLLAHYPGNTTTFSIYQNNLLSLGGHDYIRLDQGGSYHMMANNYFTEGGGQSILFQGTGVNYNLAEGNIIYQLGHHITDLSKPGMQITAGYNVIRRNIFWEIDHDAIELNSIGGDSSHHCKIYNNIFYGCNVNRDSAAKGGAIWNTRTSGYDMTYTEIANNIMYDNNGGAPRTSDPAAVAAEIIMANSAGWTGYVQHHNLILDKTSGVDDPTRQIFTTYTTDYIHLTLAQAETSYGAWFNNNLSITPSFINTSLGDFTLKSTSNGRTSAAAIAEIAPWGSPIAAGASLGAFQYYEISGGSGGSAAGLTIPGGVTIK
jgi:hypothetical protein